MSEPDDSLDIAIIGLACRFPGARDATEFWRNLAGGVESIARLSDVEIMQSGVPESHVAAPNYVKAAPVLDEPGGFDAELFGFTAEEARTMDPQHRILLELGLEALEDAGCNPHRFPGRIGVFAGTAMNTYFMHASLKQKFTEEYIPTLIVNDKDFLSTRLSYKLNLKGPSVTLQTACSTSLVAVHFARQSLLAEESDIVLAGAISVRVPHRAGYFADAGGVASPSGHVRAFDAAADGTIFGSGGGVVVLKRLRDALADGDTIRAVIKGSAINNDGAEKAGYTAPSVNSQAEAVIEALANADVEADSISYVEAHGSGTPVGDPIEIRALTKAFRSSTERSGFCAIGSVKTNVGHLDAAAGMAGLIKTVLALQHHQIPASLNFSAPNPEIDFASTPFFVNTRLMPWQSTHGPRRAGIMSTGMGGTNAHLVLEEAPQTPVVPESTQPSLLLLSARTESALAASAERTRSFLELNPAVNLDDAAFTLQTGRRAMEHRRFVVAADRAGAITSLGQKTSRFSTGQMRDGAAPPVILLLPGVGDHYVGMGRELYLTETTFRREVDRCAEILRLHLGLDIREILYPKNRDWHRGSAGRGIDLKKMLAGNNEPPDDEDTRRLNLAAHLQPALFTIEYALARMWLELGITPQAIVGHSMGEYVAACLAGTFSLEDTLHLIVRRVQLVGQLPPARMLAVSLAETELRPLLPDSLSVSLINGPALCVVAGPPGEIKEFARTLATRSVISRAVQNTHAFHSRVLDPIVEAFAAEVGKIRRNPPRISFVSNVTGQWITSAEAVDPAYWSRHLNHTARFHDALSSAWQLDNPVFLEAGPGKTLGVLAMQHPGRQASANPAAIPSLRHHYENQPDIEFLLTSVGKLWLSGLQFQWERLPGNTRRRKVSLPTYPFERQNYWTEAEASQAAPGISPAEAPLAARGIDQWFYVPSWERVSLTGGIPLAAEKTSVLWLVIADREEVAIGFQSYLRQFELPAAFAVFADRFEEQAGGSFLIDPAAPDHYSRLLAATKAASFAALHIIHLGCLADRAPAPGRAAAADPQIPGFFSLLYLAQAIAELNLVIPIAIGVVSNQIQEVTGEEDLHPEFAMALGVCGVMAREIPNIASFNVDLPAADALHSPREATVKQLIAEFTKPAQGAVIAYRGKYRWNKTFSPAELPSPGLSQGSPGQPIVKRLRNGGVYLLTGGAGGIGLALAKYLAKICQARLVLTRKTPFPKKSEWLSVLGDKTTPPSVVALINGLLEIERLGSEVEVMAADAADREQMRDVILATRQRFGALNGVIHAAGIARAGLIQTTTREMAGSMLSPKVEGAMVLHELLKGADLDFLVLFSSLASITHPFAHADYDAANSFLDAFAAYSNSREAYHTLSINWPVWKEVGMVARSEAFMGIEAWKEEALRKAILTEEGLEVFARALDSEFSQIVVSPEPLTQVLDRSRESHVSPVSSGTIMKAERSLAVAQTAPPANETESKLREIWKEIFGLDQIGVEESFFDLGGHSLLALRMISRIARTWHVNLPLRSVFDAPTITRLAAVVEAAPRSNGAALVATPIPVARRVRRETPAISDPKPAP